MENLNPEISVVIPVYFGEKSLEELVDRIVITCAKIDVFPELILVNDASPDDSWNVIKKIKQKYANVIGVNFSRNFGQHYAIMAGLEEVSGEWIVVMDCDLQDVPEEILNLYNKTNDECQIVLAKRNIRSDSFLKQYSSKIFHKALSYFTDTKQDSGVANFGIYHKDVIKAVLSLKDKIKVFPIMVKWVGFDFTHLEVEHNPRKYGKSSYTFSKLFSLAINIILSFSNKPLLLTVRMGFIISFVTCIVGIVYLIKYYLGTITVSGYTSLILSIWFLSGIIIFSIGILGLYIGKIFDNSKNRPTYIILEKI